MSHLKQFGIIESLGHKGDAVSALGEYRGQFPVRWPLTEYQVPLKSVFLQWPLSGLVYPRDGTLGER